MLGPAPGRAESADPRQIGHHVRTTDAYLRTLVQRAAVTSPSFSAILARLLGSDVIVYLRREGRMPPYLEGQVHFMGAAAGHRYVAIRVARNRTPRRHAAAIAHELQHAVEIAETPAIVDTETLAREFGRIGFKTMPGARTYESGAAIVAGERVWQEYSE